MRKSKYIVSLGDYLRFSIMLLIILCMTLAIWIQVEFGEVLTLDQIINSITVDAKVYTNGRMVRSFIVFVLLGSVLLTSILYNPILLQKITVYSKHQLIRAYNYLLRPLYRCWLKGLHWIYRYKYLHCLYYCCCCIIPLSIIFHMWQIPDFVKYRLVTTSFFEDNYREVNHVSIPAKPKNLIILFLESMESNFLHFDENTLIPNLTELAAEHISFNGYKPVYGTNYTIASLVSVFCGIPLKSVFINGKFVLETVCFPEILQQHGYKNYFLQGSSLKFASTGDFVLKHGFVTKRVFGKDELIFQKPKLARAAYGNRTWGLNDAVIFDEAKEKILAAAKQPNPFLFTIFTIDTHDKDTTTPDCDNNIYSNSTIKAIACTDKRVAEFIDWLTQQPFYEDTIVLVMGDHPGRIVNAGMPIEQQKIVNIFMNVNANKIDKNREFSSFDFAATLMEMLGINLPQHSFGLGRSLLSPTPTLVEQYGYEKLNELLKYRSSLYDSFLLETGNLLRKKDRSKGNE